MSQKMGVCDSCLVALPHNGPATAIWGWLGARLTVATRRWPREVAELQRDGEVGGTKSHSHGS